MPESGSMYEEDDAIGDVRTFTLNEALGLIPKLRKLLARVILERERLLDLRPEIDRARENADQNGGSPIGSAYIEHLTTFSETIQRIESIGVLVKDYRTGLVDFPYDRDGQIVYLCWKPDEDEIFYWHEVDAGFAGRQALTDDFE
jgi:hypothetical protein